MIQKIPGIHRHFPEETYNNSQEIQNIYYRQEFTFMYLTSRAVLFATSLAACTKCRLATGFSVFAEATLHALHKPEVCFAMTVAAESTCFEAYRYFKGSSRILLTNIGTSFLKERTQKGESRSLEHIRICYSL